MRQSARTVSAQTHWATMWNSADMPLSPPASVTGSMYSAVSMGYTATSGLESSRPASIIFEYSVSKFAEHSSPLPSAA